MNYNRGSLRTWNLIPQSRFTTSLLVIENYLIFTVVLKGPPARLINPSNQNSESAKDDISSMLHHLFYKL